MERKELNELVLKESYLERSLFETIRRTQIHFIDHIAITGKIEGKSSRDRQRITFIENLKSWASDKGSNNNFMRLTENRFEWRNMIANVCSRQGTSRRHQIAIKSSATSNNE
ncbi:hypothetical protein PoB_006865300 [Plakobranchus ocellatus]|uniref:Uncharacterized protein n=1 Tax=Plakobranchus ocellatus TaxID=259542 RepID=A0AAV4DD41_9GAST|nr:hypothetical protein PoB_006865300 [Plakobranchus ocellatus]